LGTACWARGVPAAARDATATTIANFAIFTDLSP
jgi:hypothetical protein